MKILICIFVFFALIFAFHSYASEADGYDKKPKINPSEVIRIDIGNDWQEDSLSYLQYINLEQAYISDSIPPWIVKFPNLRVLACYNVRCIPEYVGEIQLEYLEISNSELQELPEFIIKQRHLYVLTLDNNKFTHIPEGISSLDSLTVLFLNDNSISEIPEFICQMKSLKSLSLSGNNISQIPECIGNLRELEYLSLYNNEIRELPESITDLRRLETLSLSGNPIASLPEGIFSKPNRLESIYIYDTLMAKDTLLEQRIKKLKRKNWEAKSGERDKEREERRRISEEKARRRKERDKIESNKTIKP
ncbi:leucine-rich repeat domain-containing protein [Dysgonomonas sp. Marseille-P4677]|uniref:leucine-rich repeat domain-containing protein n=1 Tax=Dysgonomonas sp. Marseille-P4677 TaxID=2364790 RepID=UPI0019131F45|nr:leucine-rich repeat domain-containing protein [Dysgonomonas sp. Marseille-P4677]